MLFTYLVAFSGHGGIQKFNRCFSKALYDIAITRKVKFIATSAYDTYTLQEYLPAAFLKSHTNKLFYFLITIFHSAFHSTIFIGHINLWAVGLCIKILFPFKKVILIAHGIEVWRNLPLGANIFLKICHQVWCVSNFTAQKITLKHGVKPHTLKIFHNTIDPFFQVPENFNKPDYLLKKLAIEPHTHVITSITRLSFTEKTKGYDNIISLLSQLTHTQWVYLIGGKYDDAEYSRLKSLIAAHHFENKVILLGYIPDHELIDYYLLTDTFILPSKKEGFGIVFIEAAACGCSVIAGNADGSVDALLNGEIGQLVNPYNDLEILSALNHAIENPLNQAQKQAIQQKVMQNFSFEKYTTRLKNLLYT